MAGDVSPVAMFVSFHNEIMCIVCGGLETISLGGPVFDFARDPDKKNLISIKGRWGVLYETHHLTMFNSQTMYSESLVV